MLLQICSKHCRRAHTSRSHNNQQAPPHNQCIFHKSNRWEVSMHLYRPIRLEGFASRWHIWWVAGIAVDWQGGGGDSHTATGDSPKEASCTKQEIIRADSHALHHQLHQIPAIYALNCPQTQNDNCNTISAWCQSHKKRSLQQLF